MLHSPAGNAVVYSNAVQSQLRSEIGLYRYASGGLMKSLSPGSAVRLGEELILRVQIKSDDGGQINVLHMNSPFFFMDESEFSELTRS